MNLQKLFETQRVLDEHIYVKHPELRGQNNLDWKILALQVELGECANEWRGFKKWSHDQEPRTKVEHLCVYCNGKGIIDHFDTFDTEHTAEKCEECEGTGKISESNPLLEEYADCLGFLLTIGLELDVEDETDWDELETDQTNITKQFSCVFVKIAELIECNHYPEDRWSEILEEFYWLGILLGFTWEQVEQAYFAKNQINHERQESGY